MRDDEKRQVARRLAAEPDDVKAAAALNSEARRAGRGVIGFLAPLLEKQVWIEGVRINYRGILREVVENADGSCAGLILFPFQRISYFNKGGPDTGTSFRHTKPHFVPYECIHDVGEEGFESGNWGLLT